MSTNSTLTPTPTSSLKCNNCFTPIPDPSTLAHMYYTCDVCQATHLLYEPSPHQIAFHKDNHMIKGIFGGYGSGKSTAAMAELLDHALHTPNGQAVCVAPTVSQLEKTVEVMFKHMCPPQLIKSENKQKKTVTLINDFTLIFYPADDEEKIRSLNLTAFLMEEASGIKYNIFTQLMTRLRSDAILKSPYPTNYLGLICSNPDAGWIRSDFLFKSNKIYAPDNPKQYQIPVGEQNPFFSAHIHTSKSNQAHLPKNFIEMNSIGRPLWWIKRYLEGSFDYAEGLVYPEFGHHIIEPFPIPQHWIRIFGVDFGGRDPTVMLGAAIDPETGIIYIYDEYYQTGLDVASHAKSMKEMLIKAPPGLMHGLPTADPSGHQKEKSNGRSLFQHYAEYGIYLKPGQNKILDGLAKVYTYMSANKLKIFSSCVNTCKEGLNYKYKISELNIEKNMDEKPVDKNNHAMDTIKYMLCELPDDPNSLIHEVCSRYIIKIPDRKSRDQLLLEWAMTPNGNPVNNSQNWYNSY